MRSINYTTSTSWEVIIGQGRSVGSGKTVESVPGMLLSTNQFHDSFESSVVIGHKK